MGISGRHHMGCFILVAFLILVLSRQSAVDAQGGSWQVLNNNVGIASMHTAITRYDTAIMLDRTDVGPSQINLPNGKCRDDPNELSNKHDCTAHSVMFDTKTNSVRALEILTDTWCSSGQFFPDGTLVQTGGDFDGLKKIRRLKPCSASGTCDWVEDQSVTLTDPRWYSTNQLLPDGRQILVGGRNAFTYEFVPKRVAGEGTFYLPLLTATNDNQNDNYYPYVHLLPDGNLFIFANRDSVLLNYKTNTVLKQYPTIPGEPRNYPSAGSSVMLPLVYSNGFTVAEVLICGGAQFGAFRNPSLQPKASQTCGRIVATASSPTWAMETMPMPRNMGDMIILPSGDVLIINGAENGSQGWGDATNAVLTPVTYATNNPASRFSVLAATTIPRVYHSTANLLTDGRILVAGSNSHQFYTYIGAFPTEFRVEAFSPPYLSSSNSYLKPKIKSAPKTIGYGSTFTLTLTLPTLQGLFEVNLESAPFTTHSYAQGQRMLKLKTQVPVRGSNGLYSTTVTAPSNNVVAPPSYYMLWPVQAGTPGRAKWVQLA